MQYIHHDCDEYMLVAFCPKLVIIVVQCYSKYNNGSSGGTGDFPLCSVELKADMQTAVDTPTCFRRRMFVCMCVHPLVAVLALL